MTVGYGDLVSTRLSKPTSLGHTRDRIDEEGDQKAGPENLVLSCHFGKTLKRAIQWLLCALSIVEKGSYFVQ